MSYVEISNLNPTVTCHSVRRFYMENFGLEQFIQTVVFRTNILVLVKIKDLKMKLSAQNVSKNVFEVQSAQLIFA